MINKKLNEIEEVDLLALIENQVLEGKSLEYKRDIPGTTDGDKIKFLRSVSSFANTEGGDLLYGVEADNGTPVSLVGIGNPNQDELKLRLENMCREGIEPRLPKIEFRFVQTSQGSVLMVRILKSWVFPHRVKYVGHGHFYGRNSAGAFQLDVGELRTAFTLSESAAEKIRNFRFERLSNIHAHDTPVLIKLGCKLVLHIIPLSAFSSGDKIDISQHHDDLRQVRPLGNQGPDYNSKINLDGVVNYTNSQDGRSRAYTQIFRSGIIEAVAVFSESEDRIKRIHSSTFEGYLVDALTGYLDCLQSSDIPTPIFMYLSLVGATGYVFSVPEGSRGAYGFENNEADRDILAMPEVIIPNFGMQSDRLLRPAFDMVWNAFGYPASRNFNADGSWRH